MLHTLIIISRALRAHYKVCLRATNDPANSPMAGNQREGKEEGTRVGREREEVEGVCHALSCAA